LWAAQHNHLDELSRLMDLNKDLLRFKDADGYTALHRSSYSHQPAATLLLLKNGASIEATTEEGIILV
jgi:ankyrin repeat protein